MLLVDGVVVLHVMHKANKEGRKWKHVTGKDNVWKALEVLRVCEGSVFSPIYACLTLCICAATAADSGVEPCGKHYMQSSASLPQ